MIWLKRSIITRRSAHVYLWCSRCESIRLLNLVARFTTTQNAQWKSIELSSWALIYYMYMAIFQIKFCILSLEAVWCETCVHILIIFRTIYNNTECSVFTIHFFMCFWRQICFPCDLGEKSELTDLTEFLDASSPIECAQFLFFLTPHNAFAVRHALARNHTKKWNVKCEMWEREREKTSAPKCNM